MTTIKNEHVVFFDVDGTLILSSDPNNPVPGRKIAVWDAVTKKYIVMVAHEPNIRLLMEEKHRGSYVVVWSRGGYEWAANVIKALELQRYVNTVMTKPLVYFDDLPVDQWLNYRVFLEPDVIYKR